MQFFFFLTFIDFDNLENGPENGLLVQLLFVINFLVQNSQNKFMSQNQETDLWHETPLILNNVVFCNFWRHVLDICTLKIVLVNFVFLNRVEKKVMHDGFH